MAFKESARETMRKAQETVESLRNQKEIQEMSQYGEQIGRGETKGSMEQRLILEYLDEEFHTQESVVSILARITEGEDNTAAIANLLHAKRQFAEENRSSIPQEVMASIGEKVGTAFQNMKEGMRKKLTQELLYKKFYGSAETEDMTHEEEQEAKLAYVDAHINTITEEEKTEIVKKLEANFEGKEDSEIPLPQNGELAELREVIAEECAEEAKGLNDYFGSRIKTDAQPA